MTTAPAASTADEPVPIVLATGPRRVLYVCLGHLFTGLAILGVVLPVLPATPFLLLSSYFYVHSSPRLYRWLLGSRLFGPLLRDWQRHRGVRPHIKLTALSVVILTMTITILWGQLPPPALAGFLILSSIGALIVLRLRTIR